MKDSHKLVVDTNILFMALTNPVGKLALLLDIANQDKIELFSSESVRKEIIRVLKRETGLAEEKINKIIAGLPINWISKESYSPFLNKTKVKHKADKPIEALVIALECKIITADKKFAKALGKRAADIDELLEKF